MSNQQSGSGVSAGKDKGEQKENKKYEPPVLSRWVGIEIIWMTVVTCIDNRVGKKHKRGMAPDVANKLSGVTPHTKWSFL